MPTFNSWTDITWPTNATCSSYNLGAFPTDQNCLVNPLLSQVSDLYIQPTGATAPFDWTDPAAPTAAASAIDNSEALNAKSKWIVGKGGVAAPEEVLYNGKKLKKAIIRRVYTLEMEIEISTNTQRDFLRQLQSGYQDFVFWYGNLGDWLFGGAAGIDPNFVNVQFPLGAGDDDFEFANLFIEFISVEGDPPRVPNPLANA